MLVEKKKVTYKDSAGRRRSRQELCAQCDFCGRNFLAKKTYKASYCTKECSYASPKRSAKLSASQKLISSNVQAKVRRTCLEKYGVSHPWMVGSVRDKGVETMRRIYGSAGVLGSAELRGSYEATMLDRHGVTHPMRSDEVIASRELKCLEKNGVLHPSMMSVTTDKMKKAWIRTLGVDNPMKSALVKSKIDFVESNRKRRETLIKEDRLYTSKPELALGEWLKSTFVDVRSQSWIARQSIDYYVKDVDTYVQLDGVYWHGLMGAKHLTPNIVETSERDVKLNRWFSEHGRRLFRLTDLQWNEVVRLGGHSLLLEQLGSKFIGTKFFNHSNMTYPDVAGTSESVKK